MPSFQQWAPWADKYRVEDRGCPGVYLLARFEAGPPARVDPLCPEVVYIGETCTQTLEARWYQFNKSAFEQKAGHSGGWTFAARFCQNKVMPPFPWLYVAPLPVRLGEPHCSAYIRFVERLLIWEHVQRFGKLPCCNSK